MGSSLIALHKRSPNWVRENPTQLDCASPQTNPRTFIPTQGRPPLFGLNNLFQFKKKNITLD